MAPARNGVKIHVEGIQMRISAIWIALLLVLFASPANGQAPGWPMITSVEPQSAKPGELVAAQGSNLGSECVAALYLTDGTIDTKVEILEQTATTVKFKIPTQTK